MEFIVPVLLSAMGFVLGQISQQFIFEPLKEFKKQRADSIYFTIHFVELVRAEVSWDGDDRKNVKQMRAGLLYSMEMIPKFDFLSQIGIFGLPSRAAVEAAACKMATLAKRVQGPNRKNEPSDLQLARDIGKLLGAKFNLDALGTSVS